MTLQTKWHSHALVIHKNANQEQTNHKRMKAKNSNKQHGSIPMGSQCFQGKAQPESSIRFHGSLFALQFPASYFHKHITISA